MKIKQYLLIFLFVLINCVAISVQAMTSEEAWNRLKTYQYGDDFEPLLIIEQEVLQSTVSTETKEKYAARLAALLNNQTTYAGREFHSILCNTNPEFFGLCLEQLWSFRGCGHSQQALFDHIKLYQDRIYEVHLRQTANHILCESYEDGDMDNVKLADELRKLKTPPHLLIEQSPVDPETPKTISADESIRRSIAYVRRVFNC
ncbi:MAG: hypothetical protein LBE12_11995 [Planctomycetaceae bacterium]|jgi:hypothetical protein|nr:hypothetical protein [Planctomycetaceae bacterium]